MESPEMEGDGKRRKVVVLPMMCFEAPVVVVKAEAKAAAAAQKAPSRGRTDDLRLQRKQEQGEKKGDMWTAEEDRRIREAVLYHGRKWHEIAAGLPGRSANAVRNRRQTPAMHPGRSPAPGQVLGSPLTNCCTAPYQLPPHPYQLPPHP